MIYEPAIIIYESKEWRELINNFNCCIYYKSDKSNSFYNVWIVKY